MKNFLWISVLITAGSFASAQPGSLDFSFDPGIGTDGAGTIATSCIQPDGKIIIGGHFTSYNGTTIYHIARINTDGSLDMTFDPGWGANNDVRTLALQPDGKIIIGGYFASYDGVPRSYIARINPDGSLDTSFDPGTGASSSVSAIALQPDGKIIIGGAFNTYNGTTIFRIARLNSDGSLDFSFNPGTGPDIGISSLSLQTDGKCIIGGYFTTYNGFSRNHIARINPNGSIDLSFNPGTGTNEKVWATAIQPDGKIIIGGRFTLYNGTSRNYLARLNTDGSLDTGFDPATGANNDVFAIALQPDGKIIIGGWFTSYDWIVRNRLARINSDSSLDLTFDTSTGASSAVQTIALQTDGKMVIGGHFMYYDDISRLRIARVNKCNSKSTIYEEGCDVYTVPSGDETYTSNGIYYDTIPNFYGCDSVLTINLFLNYSATATINASGCTDYIVPSGNAVYNVDGVYQDTILTSAGCDSILSINLTLGSAYTAVSIFGNTLKAEANGVNYQWISCPSMIPIPGETNKYLYSGGTGNYAVIITDDFCVDTSLCYFVSDIGLTDFEKSKITVFPNPFSESITISTENFIELYDVVIVNALGEIIYHSTITNEKTTIDLTEISPGIFFVVLLTDSDSGIVKIVKH